MEQRWSLTFGFESMCWDVWIFGFIDVEVEYPKMKDMRHDFLRRCTSHSSN